MTLLKLILFGVMQCVYVVHGKKTHFPHTVHYFCSSMLRLSESVDFYKAQYSEMRGML